MTLDNAQVNPGIETGQGFRRYFIAIQSQQEFLLIGRGWRKKGCLHAVTKPAGHVTVDPAQLHHIL